jgi:hypothetical protein
MEMADERSESSTRCIKYRVSLLRLVSRDASTRFSSVGMPRLAWKHPSTRSSVSASARSTVRCSYYHAPRRLPGVYTAVTAGVVIVKTD